MYVYIYVHAHVCGSFIVVGEAGEEAGLETWVYTEDSLWLNDI